METRIAPGSGWRATGPRLVRWLVRGGVALLVVYGLGLAALLATRPGYLAQSRLYMAAGDSLEWQGREGPGYRVWTAGPGSFELWRAYRWIPAIRDARDVWRQGQDDQRSGTGGPDP